MEYLTQETEAVIEESLQTQSTITLSLPDGAEQTKVYKRPQNGVYQHTLNLTKEALQHMTAHAEAVFPYECCGFFYGKDGEIRKISYAQAVENSKDGDQRRRFEISPFDYMKAEQFALNHNLDLLGIYHSHPNHVALPSVHDQKQAVPFFSYIIVSVRDGHTDHVLSWQLDNEGVFEEEKITVESER